MDLIGGRNLTTGSPDPGVTYWESTARISTAVKDTIVVLGILTFVLQLCLILFLALKCWRLDSRVRRAKAPREEDRRPVWTAPDRFSAVRIDDDDGDFLYPPPSVHWDLVQSG